jgi:hypothetical protein
MIMPVRRSVRMFQLDIPWPDFDEILLERQVVRGHRKFAMVMKSSICRTLRNFYFPTIGNNNVADA